MQYGDVSFGFYEQGVLDFIAVVEAKENIFLWDSNPFLIAQSNDCPYYAIKDWIDQRKHDSTTDHTSFGGTLSVEGLGVTFCFPLPDWDELEGVQLYPQWHIKSWRPTGCLA